MSWNSVLSIGPTEIVAAVFSLPLISLVLALIVAGGILLVASRPRRQICGSAQLSEAAARSIRMRYLPEDRALGIAALGVVILFAVENVLRGYVLNVPGLVSWWRFATPVFCALLGMSVVLGLIIARGSTPSEMPVVPAVRRTWTSFSPRSSVVGASLVLLVLLATTIGAGLASSANGEGRYVWLEIPVPNEAAIDPIRVGFYGWAYGAPVLMCLAALAGVTWAVLHSNASRSYIRPETVAAERDARREVAIGAVRVTTAGMLLAVAGAWRLIASSGTISYLTIEGQNGGAPYDVVWRYAELAAVAGWCAPILEIIAFILLLLVASRLRRKSGTRSPSEHAELDTVVEAVL